MVMTSKGTDAKLLDAKVVAQVKEIGGFSDLVSSYEHIEAIASLLKRTFNMFLKEVPEGWINKADLAMGIAIFIEHVCEVRLAPPGTAEAVRKDMSLRFIAAIEKAIRVGLDVENFDA